MVNAHSQTEFKLKGYDSLLVGSAVPSAIYQLISSAVRHYMSKSVLRHLPINSCIYVQRNQLGKTV